MFSRPSKLILVSLLSVILSQFVSGAVQADEDPPVAEPTSVSLAHSHNDLGLTIDNVNDLGFALQRIRQQAINIYVEATRKENSDEVSAAIPTLTKVPRHLPKDMTHLLPFRRPWLFYFVATLEPLVHLLKEDIKDLDSGAKTLDITPATRQAIDPLLKEWSILVKKLDERLVEASDLMEDAEKSNVELAKIACHLEAEVSALEFVREKAFRIVDTMEKPVKKTATKSAKKTAKKTAAESH